MNNPAGAYEHCARMLEERLSISHNVDGEHAEAVAIAFTPVIARMLSCAAALRRRPGPVDLNAILEAAE